MTWRRRLGRHSYFLPKFNQSLQSLCGIEVFNLDCLRSTISQRLIGLQTSKKIKVKSLFALVHCACVMWSLWISHLEPSVWSELSHLIHHILWEEGVVENIGGCEPLPRVHHQHPRDLRTPRGEFDSGFAPASHFEDINWVTELILPNLWPCLSGPPTPETRSRTVRPRSCAASSSVSCARRAESLRAACTWSPLNSICRHEPEGNQTVCSYKLHMIAYTELNAIYTSHRLKFSLYIWQLNNLPTVLCHFCLCTLTCPQQCRILRVLHPWSTRWSQERDNQGSHTPLCLRQVKLMNL